MKIVKTLVGIAAILLLLAFPLVGDLSLDSIAVDVLLLTSAIAAWNIFSGYTGYISLGHATFYGIGAYALALVTQDWHIQGGWMPFLLIPLVGLVCGVFAVPMGWIALRVKRHTFLVMTIAIFFLFQSLSYNLRGITGGSMGIFLPLPDWDADIYYLPFYYLAGAVLLLVTVLSWRIRYSKFGLELLAIRDDEDRAYGLGINTGHYKLVAYTLSASLFGAIGAISAYLQGNLTPSVAFDPVLNLTVVVACYLGGIGTIAGPIVGGVLLVSVQTFLIQQFGATITGLDQVLLGGFLLVIILRLPEGIVPALVQSWNVLRFKQRTRSERIISSSTAVSFEQTSSSEAAEAKDQSVLSSQANEAHIQIIPLLLTDPQDVKYHSGKLLARTKAQRLTPLPAEKSASGIEQRVTMPVGSWRCPICRKPFLLKGGLCYCPRCNLTRPLELQKPQLSS